MGRASLTEKHDMAKILRVVDVIEWSASALARLMLIFVALSLVLQVILRFGFSFSLPWPEEASRYLMIWLVMLTAPILIKRDELVRVDFLDAFWPRPLLIFRDLLFRFCMLGLFIIVAHEGWIQASFAARRLTAATQISWFWPYLAVPVGAVLIIIELLAITLREQLARQAKSTSLSQVTESAQ